MTLTFAAPNHREKSKITSRLRENHASKFKIHAFSISSNFEICGFPRK